MILRALVAVAALAAPLLAASAARADRIDGAWCLTKAGRMVINGPAIQTPGGNTTQGDYSRHAFHYVVPPGEAGSGSEVRMQLLGEEAVQVQRGGLPPEIWHRCGQAVS